MRWKLGIVSAALVVACGDDTTASEEAGADGESGAAADDNDDDGDDDDDDDTGPGDDDDDDATGPGDDDDDATGPDDDDDDDDTGDGGTTSGDPPMPTAIELPQAVAGWMFANPSTYPEIPVHIHVEGGAEQVTVQLDDGDAIFAEPGDESGDWIATVPIAGEGDHTVRATALGGGEVQETMAELRTGSQGMKITDYDVEGPADTPRLHRVDDRLILTWIDERSGDGDAWLAEIDGAGQLLGDPMLISPPGTAPTTAVAAIGQDAVAVLYQRNATPYSNHLHVAALDTGEELLPPMDLDDRAFEGAFGGDIVHDGTGFVAVWRSFTATSSEVRWLRLDGENDWAVTGPEVAWNEDDGNLQPFTYLRVAANPGGSVVSWAYDSDDAGFTMQKAAYNAFLPDGTSLGSGCIGGCADFLWHWEVQLGVVHDTIVALRPSDNLGGARPIPTDLWIATFDDRALGDGPDEQALAITAADTRSEPTIASVSPGWAMMAWLDYRNPTITLYAAPVDDALAAGDEASFGHARFIANTSELDSVGAGSNAILSWIDDRTGSGLLDPHPEVYLETAWH